MSCEQNPPPKKKTWLKLKTIWGAPWRRPALEEDRSFHCAIDVPHVFELKWGHWCVGVRRGEWGKRRERWSRAESRNWSMHRVHSLHQACSALCHLPAAPPCDWFSFGNSTWARLDKSRTLRENLMDRAIVEYPVLHVALPQDRLGAMFHVFAGQHAWYIMISCMLKIRWFAFTYEFVRMRCSPRGR